MERKVDVVEDLDGKKTVFIHDILFKGKRTINWGEVERYLKRYVGEIYTVAASNDVVYIGPDLPDEYAHSNYTHILRGTNAKAKANAVQGLPELMEVANGRAIQKITKRNIIQMLCMVGTVMSQDLLYLCLMPTGRLQDIIFLM